MAVESRFVVIRNGIEAKTFMDKKSADEYDKMLDMADNLSQVFSQSSVELSDSVNEELSIYLAQNREAVLVALLAKKPAKETTKPATKKTAINTNDEPIVKVVEQASNKDEKSPVKAKKSKTKATAVKLSAAS
ncbi:YebG family protein [Colwellia piezophila]|uniref:YebG family protein n=1 Tax=Colwellia piezophila TaxID=211668 RepID=UPI00036DF24F|nr:YebG family protein [Colwellia piezophila]